jgi:protein TonB
VSLAPEPGAAGQSEATPAPATGEFTGSTNATPEGEADGAGGRRGSAPSLGHLVQPRYPESARRAGIQGRALLAVTVHADGTVGDIRLKQSAGHDDLDAAAVDAVKRWRFAPAQRWGTAVDFCCVEIPIDFHLH